MMYNKFKRVYFHSLNSSLQALGLISNMHRYLVASSLDSLGLNNGSIYGTQGQNHIAVLMNFGEKQLHYKTTPQGLH